jgi:hypothetical protein
MTSLPAIAAINAVSNIHTARRSHPAIEHRGTNRRAGYRSVETIARAMRGRTERWLDLDDQSLYVARKQVQSRWKSVQIAARPVMLLFSFWRIRRCCATERMALWSAGRSGQRIVTTWVNTRPRFRGRLYGGRHHRRCRVRLSAMAAAVARHHLHAQSHESIASEPSSRLAVAAATVTTGIK